ncbi:RHS repeat-associated core domain-containing protein [Chryseobacterium sp.]|uniref:RHS repeat-associated core domain-containing protein n=2 Tax=unclassified Chryseobacterium TaxID=2593645 RepID=UPI00260455B5|nr:RHS repeat-associated core domain-containing protein [Chryseobacterium sp.]
MKINTDQFPVTKKSFLLMSFFVCMFVFASFTKEDRQRVRRFKKELMSKLTDTKVDLPDSNAKENSFNQLIQSETSPQKKLLGGDHPLFLDLAKKNTRLSEFKNEVIDNDNFYSSKEKEGTIGTFTDQEEDEVSDNFFTIDIPSVEENTIAYLEYDLFGLASHESVSRSVNHNIAMGGGIIVPSAKWSHQKEAVNSELIKTGSNSILFTSPAFGVKYKVKNLRLVFEKDKKSNDRPIVSSMLSGDQLYVKGNTGSLSDIVINNEVIAVKKGEFEKVIRLSEKNKADGAFSITAGGIVNTYKIPVSTKAFKIVDNYYAKPKGIEVTKDKEFSISYENMNVSIEKETSESAYIEVLKLREKDLPAVSQGLKNVTLNNSGYRFSVLSGKLEKNAKISIPYDVKRLGMFSPKDIKIFHFDYAKKQWVADQSVVDEKNKTVTVEGKGDHDYINGIISAPESPQTTAFSPTSISGLKAADPMAGMQLMNAPTANQKGDANMNYPIRVPAGLGGVQPSLAIGYNSGAGNGWMGEGWDLQGLSAITVDTRWGTPMFGSEETELYTLDGEMLVYPGGYLPHRHNNVSEASTDITTARQPRNPAGKKQFYLRKNHDFTLIEREGDGPANYSWKVTSTNGTKSYYGGSDNSVIKNAEGQIVHWGLRMVEDTHDNKMMFTYQNNTNVNIGTGNNANGGTYFHIQKITYGKGQDYSVSFVTENTLTRKDININAKQGVKRVEPYLLKSVDVSYKTQKIRSYRAEYEDGQFSKTRLRRLYIQGYNIKDPHPLPIVDDYNFEYYNEVENNQIFGADTQLQVNYENPYPSIIGDLLKPSKINGNISTESGLNFRAAAGLNFFYSSNDAYGHLMFGFPFGYSTAEAKNVQQLIDFNGDGIQDMIYRTSSELTYSEGKLDIYGRLSFLSPKPILNYNSNFSFTETKTNNSGWDMGAIVYSKSSITSTSKGITSTYLIDANSDGLVDIVSDGKVWFNKYNSSGQPEMTQHSEYTENMVVKVKPIAPPLIPPPGPKVPPIVEPDYPPTPIADVVKVWIASQDGYITINDNVSVSGIDPLNPSPVNPLNPTDKAYYSIEIANPDYVPGGTQPNNFYNARVFLTQLNPNNLSQSVTISRYNDYYSQIINVPAGNTLYNIHGAINNSNRLFVKSGEKVYIRLHKNADTNLQIDSNPTVTYIDPATGLALRGRNLEQDQFKLNNGSYGINLFMNNLIAPIYLDAAGTAQIRVNSINFPSSSDSFTFKVIKENTVTGAVTVLHSQSYNQSTTSFDTQDYTDTITINAGEPVYLKFIVESDTNTGFLGNNWNSAITVNYKATSPSVNLKFSPSAQYPSFAVTKLKERLGISGMQTNPVLSGFHDFGVQINKDIANASTLGTGSFYYIVKKLGQVIAKRKVTITAAQGIAPTVVEENMLTGQAIPGIDPIIIYSGDLTQPSLDLGFNVQVYCQTGAEYALFDKYSEYFQGKPFNIYYDTSILLTKVWPTSVNTAMYNTKSAIYNNWGQFLYKPNNDVEYSYGTPIEAEAFTGNVALQNTYPSCQGLTGQALTDCVASNGNTTCQGLSGQAFIDCVASNGNPTSGNNTVSQYVSPMKPYSVWIIQNRPLPMKRVDSWIGTSTEQFSMATSFRDHEEINYFSNPVPNPPAISPTSLVNGVLSLDTTMKAISKKQSSRSKNTTNGLSVGTVSAGNSETLPLKDGSIETQTFSDMNGDGYPDMVYPESIQYTNSVGSLDDIKLVATGDFPTNTYSYLKVNSLGFSFNVFSASGRDKANGPTGTSSKSNNSMPWSVGVTAGAGASDYFNSYDSGRAFWTDVNGDGLPDRIIDYNTIMFNLGKSLSEPTSYQNMISYRSHPIGGLNFSIGGGLGSFANLSALSNFGFGISASAGGSGSKGTAEVVYEDINGDGLIDIVEVDNNNKSAKVRYNLGNKFDTAVPLLKAAGKVDFTEETGSYNGYVSFGGSLMLNFGPIPIIPPAILVIFIKAGAGATANLGINVSETKKAFRDMNGDGFPDLVVDTNDGFIVNYSLIGQTNKLKTVTHAITKGQYTVNYKFTQPNYKDPHAKLVVDEVRILNPDVFSTNYTQSDATKDIVTKYTFEKSKYDRRERDNFGFEKVTSEQLSAAGSTYRKTVDTYYNTSYFLNGLIKESKILSGNDELISKVNYNYHVYRFKDNVTKIDANYLPEGFDTGGTEGRKMAVVLLDKKVNTRYENGGEVETTEKMEYDYNTGLVSNYTYTSPTNSYKSAIQYWGQLNNNIIGVPKQINVYDGTGSTLLRQRSTQNVNANTGDIGKYIVFDGSQNIETDYTYETSGNVKTVTYPPDETSNRYSISYEYDGETGKYVARATDAFGYISFGEYNPYFDVLTKSTDITGNVIYYAYDDFGRMVAVNDPYSLAGNSTLTHSYYFDHYGIPNSNQTIKIFRATTSHYDADHPTNLINTDSYSDFMGRVIQVKKDVDINGTERRSISGRPVFDVLGRQVYQYQPQEGDLQDNNLNLNLSQYMLANTYDVSDRITNVKYEDGVEKSIRYEIEGNLFKTTEELDVTKTETFTNAEGQVVEKVNYLDSDPLSTKFEYNTVGELLKVIDPQGIKTTYQYNLAGRRTEMMHPDKGLTTYVYDSAGHLIKFGTANLANDPTIQTHQIHYRYDKNRLTDIELPNLPTGTVNPNNVHYDYMPANSGNNSGRIITKTDGTGYTTYNYGKLGEVISETRRIFGYNIPTMEFKTDYVYDSWNRLKKLTYPDGEQLSYSYDLGGNLKTVTNGSYNYIQNIRYDHYEQRTGTDYGNGTKTTYSYLDTNRRLSYFGLWSTTNQFLSNRYDYDKRGNIVRLGNDVGVTQNQMGGTYAFKYGYDTLNRLIGTESDMGLNDKGGTPTTPNNSPYSQSNSHFDLKRIRYNESGGMVLKEQVHQINQQPEPLNTYSNNYKYIPDTHKVEAIIDGNISGAQQFFSYDDNGNTIKHADEFGAKQMFWDEQDRMKAFYSDDSGVYQYYAYDDKGERTIKYNLHGSSQLYQNGELVDPGSLSLTDYTLYPNSYVTVSLNGQYTKHYFEGSTRFASRVMDGSNIFIPLNLRTSDQATTMREPDPSVDFKTYLEKAGVGDISVSELNTLNGPTSQLGLYYLHNDHLGTATFVTNSSGQSTQFFLNLPFGETMLEQRTGVYDNPYKFNAKELDRETGLYYYGARYYNPRASIWYGVDPLAEQTMEPYIYCGNNPINYIDPNGNFRLPANATREQRRLYKEAVKTIKGVFRDSEFRGAFKERFGVDDKMIQTMLRDGDGPTVIMNESLLDLAHFDPDDPNVIKIDSGVVNTVSKNKGNKKYIDNLAEIIIHEGGHWADYKMDGKSQEKDGIFKMSLQSKSGRADAGDNWEVIYFGTDTQFSASDRDIITEKFDKIRMNNFRKDSRQQREIRDSKSQKMPSILDIYKKPKDNLRTSGCY